MKTKYLIAFTLIALSPARGSSAAVPSDDTSSADSVRGSSVFFPYARAALDTAGYFRNPMDFSAEQTGLIEVGIARYRALSFSLTLKERNIYGGKGYPRSEPWTIEYIPLEFLHARYDTGSGYLGLLLDHECYNGIDREVDVPDRYRWYGIALKWESPAFLPESAHYAGLRDGIISPADALHFSLYAGREIKTVAYPYKFRFQGDLRYDLAKSGPFIPYLKGNVTVITSSGGTRVNRSGEAGCMIVSERAILAPYLRYSYRNDIDRFDGKSAGFVTAGAWCESAFDTDDSASSSRGMTPAYQFLPDMHFVTSYGRHFFNRTYGNDAVCNVALDVLRVNAVTFFAESDLNHNSPEPVYFMFPAYIDYTNTGGVSVEPGVADSVFTGGYSFVRYHLGDRDNRFPEKHRDAFVMIESAGMNRAHRYNTLCAARDTASAAPAGWKILIERRFARRNSPYAWKFAGGAEWTVSPVYGFIPYLAPEIDFMYGDRHDLCGSVETGAHFMNGILITVFCRYENTMQPDNGGRRREQSLYAGIRGER